MTNSIQPKRTVFHLHYAVNRTFYVVKTSKTIDQSVIRYPMMAAFDTNMLIWAFELVIGSLFFDIRFIFFCNLVAFCSQQFKLHAK